MIEPPAGGATPLSRVAGSSILERSVGVSSVTHTRVPRTLMAGLSFTLGVGPSEITTALPAASTPVTIRRICMGSMVLSSTFLVVWLPVQAGAGLTVSAILGISPPSQISTAPRGSPVPEASQWWLAYSGSHRRGFQASVT